MLHSPLFFLLTASFFFFFFNDPATTEIYTLSLHDALPISGCVEDSLRLRHGIWPRCQTSGSACGQAAAAQALFDRCPAGGIETPTGRRGGGLIRRYLSFRSRARGGRSAS